MNVITILLIAMFLAVPIIVKYALAFEMRDLVDRVKLEQKEVRCLAAQLRALKREQLSVRRVVRYATTQAQQAEVRRGIMVEKLDRTRSVADSGLIPA